MKRNDLKSRMRRLQATDHKLAIVTSALMIYLILAGFTAWLR